MADCADIQPVEEEVNINLTVPCDIPVTIPPLVIVATAILVLVQVPPDDGDIVVVFPTQIGLFPVIETVGLAFTVMGKVAADIHPDDDNVNLNVAVPAETPCTNPELVTVATVGLRLVQLPPIVGASVVTEPTQMVVAPVILTTGLLLTVIGVEALDKHTVLVSVNVKLTVPALTPVIIPPLVIDAMAGLLLTHEPPDAGKMEVVPPIQIDDGPFSVMAGLPFTVI